MLNQKHIAILAMAAIAWSVAAVDTFAQGRNPYPEQAMPMEEAGLIAVLQSAAPLHEKAVACKLLAVVGTKNAVPVLAGLLSDEQLSHYARFGLEPIPDPSVDEALQSAAKSLKGPLLVGVLNSIGARKNPQSIDMLRKLLSDQDGDVVAASAAALSRIGNLDAAKILGRRLSNTPDEFRPALADACLKCAERLAADGNRQQAAAMYNLLRQADLPERLKVAATYEAIVVDQASSIPLLVEQLKAENLGLFDAALQASRQLTGSNVTQALMGELDNLPEERKALVIAALGDRGEAAAMAPVLEAAQSDSPALKLAAIRALAKLGGADAADMLLETAIQPNGDIAKAAQNGVIALPSDNVDSKIVDKLKNSEGDARLVLIELAGRRRINSAVPALAQAAKDSNAQTRRAAVLALGNTVGLDGITTLTERLTEARDRDDIFALQQALVAACMRMSDREAAAGKLSAAIEDASIPVKIRLLEVLGSVGGTKALDAVNTAAMNSDDQIQDAATRVLGEWMTPDVAPKLLELAKNHPSNKYKIRVLRGYIRIARQLGVTDAERDAMCREAVAVALRDDEKRLVFETLGRYPSPDGLTIVVSQLDSPSLKQEAAATAVSIAEIIASDHPSQVADAMRKVVNSDVTGKPANKAKAILDKAGK